MVALAVVLVVAVTVVIRKIVKNSLFYKERFVHASVLHYIWHPRYNDIVKV